MLLIAFGVRQGCVIAPDAFATGMDWLLDASAALAWYPALVAARYFPRDGCLAHSVCDASVVGHVLGRGPLLRRSKQLGYYSDDVPVVADLFNTADDDFFHRVKTNSDHVL